MNLQTTIPPNHYFDPKLLLPASEDTESGKLVVHYSISDREALFAINERRDYLARIWRTMYEDLLARIARITIGRDEYFVIKFHPMIEYKGDMFMSKLQLGADVLVAETKNVVIPTITWDNSGGVFRMKEWRCGYCSAPNVLEDRECCKCGAPRAKLIQEM